MAIAKGTLHLANGGYLKNTDKVDLESLAQTGKLSGQWTLPKAARIGDEVVIKVGKFGLFATGRVASAPKLRTDVKGYRYGAALRAIEIIQNPIPISIVQDRIPDLKWAQYPRSITTPSSPSADKIRALVNIYSRNSMAAKASFGGAGPDEVEAVASLERTTSRAPKQQLVNRYIRAASVRKMVLDRAQGCCEGCRADAPFLTQTGRPYLETHHVVRRAENGPDSLWSVIALCPNCHRRTEFGEDSNSFNEGLTRILHQLQQQNTNKKKRPSSSQSVSKTDTEP